MRARPALLALLVVAALTRAASTQPAMQEWPIYGGDAGGSKFSPLADIDRENVARLTQVWEWKPEEGPLEAFGTRPGNFQNTPLMIDNVLYVS
ncbi:MAG: hypothetical protein ABI880_16380, partial [Acidobacteriota bacterium]